MLDAAVHEASASEVSPEERILYLARVSAWGHRGLGNDALVDLSGGGIADVHLRAGEGGDYNDGDTQALLLRFMETWYRPERMTLVGVGLDHERLVELAEEYLGERPLPRSREQLVSTPLAAWSTPGALQQLSPPPEALLEATIAPPSTVLQADSISSSACRLASFFGLGGTPPPPPLPSPVLPPPLPDSTPPLELVSIPSEFAGGCLAFDVLDGGPTYVAVAFEGLPEGHPDTVRSRRRRDTAMLCLRKDFQFILEVIARILGGRSRFQAGRPFWPLIFPNERRPLTLLLHVCPIGGPGSTHQKTRLAKHVLAPLSFIQHIEAFNHAYSDAGLSPASQASGSFAHQLIAASSCLISPRSHGCHLFPRSGLNDPIPLPRSTRPNSPAVPCTCAPSSPFSPIPTISPAFIIWLWSKGPWKSPPKESSSPIDARSRHRARARACQGVHDGRLVSREGEPFVAREPCECGSLPLRGSYN